MKDVYIVSACISLTVKEVRLVRMNGQFKIKFPINKFLHLIVTGLKIFFMWLFLNLIHKMKMNYFLERCYS